MRKRPIRSTARPVMRCMTGTPFCGRRKWIFKPICMSWARWKRSCMKSGLQTLRYIPPLRKRSPEQTRRKCFCTNAAAEENTCRRLTYPGLDSRGCFLFARPCLTGGAQRMRSRLTEHAAASHSLPSLFLPFASPSSPSLVALRPPLLLSHPCPGGLRKRRIKMLVRH